MRINDENFKWTLHEIQWGHENSAQDKINPVAAKYFSEVSRVDIGWWDDWIRAPHSSSSITVSHHQLTLFAAVISKHERTLCANAARGLGGEKGESIGSTIENYIWNDWWPSEFPIDLD
jgi:hypothetical protein